MQWMITRGTPIYGNPHVVKPNAIHLPFQDGLFNMYQPFMVILGMVYEIGFTTLSI